MSDEPDRLSPQDEQDLQAAEYVMGLLPPNQARALEALALTDNAVAGSVAAWERRLAPLAALAGPVPPPPVLWRRLALATGIDSGIQTQRPAQPFNPPQPARYGIGLLQGTTAAALALAACMAYLLITHPSASPATESLLAALSPANGPGPVFLVRVGPNGQASVIAIGDTNVPRGRSLELWAVVGTAAPVSMGLLPVSGRATLSIPEASGTQLLVSQEPAGGSPTKAPTGPVVYAGKLTGI